MKIRLTIREYCLKHGIRNAYGLQRKLNLWPTTARNCWNSDGQRVVRLDLLERLCEGLDCELSDLLKVESEPVKPVATTKKK